MNKVYKTIWSKVRNCYVVVSELVKSRTKSPSGGSVRSMDLGDKISLHLHKGGYEACMPGAFVTNTYATNRIPEPDSKPFTITVAAIVKNEAENVPQWVQAARSCADEIIVVDTGSTDGTVERFRDYGIECYHYEWRDDFASAKNYMISLCHGDWIVLLDGDEWFREGCDVRKAIAKHHANPITKAIIADWICLDKDRNNAVMFSGGAVRAFRNQPDVRYFRRVHENLTIGIENFAFEPEFKMYHTGYSGSVNRSKHERNLRIMRTMFDFDNGKVEYPTDWRYIEDTYAGLGQFDKALWAADKMISYGVQEYSAAAWITKFNVLFAIKTPLAEMRKQFEYCFETVPSVSGFRFLASIYYFRNGLITEGLDNYIEGLRMLMGPQDKVAMEHTYWRMYMPEASALASTVYLQNKQFEASLYACKVCEQYCGQTDWTNRALADVRQVMNQSEESLLDNITERVLPVLQFGKKAVLATALASSLTVGMVGVPNLVLADSVLGACCNLNGIFTNQVTGETSTVTGGDKNKASGYHSSVSGGSNNTASGVNAFVSSGYLNIASGQHSSVIGGYRNTASGHGSTAIGGYVNKASGDYSFVSGGSCSIASGCYSSVFGGWHNIASGGSSSVSGGSCNTVSGCYSSVSGGKENYIVPLYAYLDSNGKVAYINGDSAVVSGNQLFIGECSYPILSIYSASNASISGGRNNLVHGDYSSISGGACNIAKGISSSVSGGQYNQASGNYSFISGGYGNIASGCASSALGGYSGHAYANYSTVIGGGITGVSTCAITAIGSVAIGSGATTTKNYEVAIGSACAPVTLGGNLTVNGMNTVTDGVITKTWTELLNGLNTIVNVDNESISVGNSLIDVKNNNGENRVITGVITNHNDLNSVANVAYVNAICEFIIDSINNVSGDSNNVASGLSSIVSGGDWNTASGCYSSVSGGSNNTSSGCYSSVSGGLCNVASGSNSSVSGGFCNSSIGISSSVSGGNCNVSSCYFSSVSGGYNNSACGQSSWIAGGTDGFAYAEYSSSIGGGITGNADCSQTALGSVAIGKCAITTRNYEVTIGSACSPVTIGGDLTVTETNTVTAGNKTKTWNQILADNSYTLPVATSSTLGGVKIGSNITNSSGTISLTKTDVTSALGYTPPTADTNTTYSAFTGASSSVAGSAGLVKAPVAGDQAKFLRGDGTWAADNDTHYTSHMYVGSGSAANAATTNGNTKIALSDDSTVRNTLTIKGTGATTVTSDANGVITINSTDANTTYSDFIGANATAAGSAGLVKAPAAGDQNKFLRGDGTWVKITTDSGTVANAVSYDDAEASTLTLEGEAGVGTKITNLADAELYAGSKDAVTGGQMYAVTQCFDEFQSALSRNNTSIARAQTDINNIKTTNLNLQSAVNTLNTQMEAGMNVMVDGELVKKINPDSNYINMISGDNITIVNDDDSVKISAKADGVIAAGNTGLVTGGQVYNALQTYSGTVANIDGGVYDTNSDTLTFIGDKGTKLTNLKQGTLSASSTDAVTGAQLYATNHNISGFATDINRNKENIRELNTNIVAALESVSTMGYFVDNIDRLKADSSLNNLTAIGRQVIANEATNAVQKYLSANPVLNASRPVTDSALSSPSNTLNITDAGNGSLHVGEGSSVSGTSSIAIGVGNQVNANNAGAFGDPSVINADGSYVLGNDDTVNTGAVNSFIVGNDSVSNAEGSLIMGNHVTSNGKNGMALGNSSNVSAENAIALGYGSVADEKDTLSVGNDTLKRRITNLADGNLTAGSSDAVTGFQLYATNERVKANEEAITKKADTDASNINIDKWTEKLGTGKIEDGNGGLVTGGTVYDAVTNMKDAITNASPVKVDGDNIYIGVDMGGNTISVANNKGDGRVITGVATNPQDASSAANVGYVNAVGQNIVQGVSEAFTRVNDRMDKVGAGAAAMAGLVPGSFEEDTKWNLSASVGNYRSATAGAVGAFYKPTGNVTIALKGAFGNGENMVSGGVGVALNKGDIPGVTKRQLATEVVSLKARIERLEAALLQAQAGRK